MKIAKLTVRNQKDGHEWMLEGIETNDADAFNLLRLVRDITKGLKELKRLKGAKL